MKKRFSVIAINLFIIANLMMMIRAQLDQKSPIINFVYTPITYFQYYFSMWRGWSMFAPEPMRMNSYVDAKVIFEDGTQTIFNFTDIENISLFDRYIYNERFRKYMTDGLRLDNKSYLWKDGAKFVLRKVDIANPKKMVKSVTFRRRWQPLDKWFMPLVPHRKEIDRTKFKTYEYYTYEVDE